MTEQQGTTRRQRRTSAQIEQMVRDFRDSGLTGRQFCLREGLSPSILYRYLRRAASGEMERKDGLVAVELASRKPSREADSCGLAVVLAGGEPSQSAPASMG
jgi:hypothetical protein